MNVAEALALARTFGLPRSDANVLLGALLGRSRTWLLTHDDAPLDAAQQTRWQDWLARRADGIPVAYLTGQHEFHGLLLHVTPDVLDPRPDTETLVDWALEVLNTRPPGAKVVDLGTGSGAIALAIQHRQPDAVVSAVDLSPAALAVAQGNGERLGLRVRWRLGAWFAPLAGEHFDLVVSNPPYIVEGDAHLPALRHEPTLALTSGADGLDAIRQIVADAPAHLQPGGWLLLEHGHDQGPAVAALLDAAGWRGTDRRNDLAGHWRCTGAMRPTG
ncbi:peptide chain release factor N(5)-glutamine methyltransferase [Sphaerotilus sp.]|uniref:peptide chain release factor N(5)-glutamine methyltransferase n=1 Tax=Sphaerotilus sp. TaxID=2093942 RepID=UPI002ACDDD5A|nr:peptide chain release factor N(5)-glutamine methyltransferase [Sphaerotilus sp.]MDZ7855237.1 peptide chain release factor N(5)-glutamine methyltransferase [Sphaerotilus sp.]